MERPEEESGPAEDGGNPPAPPDATKGGEEPRADAEPVDVSAAGDVRRTSDAMQRLVADQSPGLRAASARLMEAADQASQEVARFTQVRESMESTYVTQFVTQLAQLYEQVWNSYIRFMQASGSQAHGGRATTTKEDFNSILDLLDYDLTAYGAERLATAPGAEYDPSCMRLLREDAHGGQRSRGRVRLSLRSGYRFHGQVLAREIVELG